MNSVLETTIFCLFGLFLLPVVLGLGSDYLNYLKQRKKFRQTFGLYVGQILKVVKQNEKVGSVLENNLSLFDAWSERGIVFYTFKKGDSIKILPFPKFRPFQKTGTTFLKTNQEIFNYDLERT
ncbi:TPA: hypothetical protein DEA21_03980 [Candidatus Uhrbacteria bacterium]|nr:hypothetical protein [Candidatus Uhrbacteria bacterium]HCU31778.1 hypothetical protein [Candidatus Uhrbacteria bacterium]